MMKRSRYKKGDDGPDGRSQYVSIAPYQPQPDRYARRKRSVSEVLTMVFVAYALATCLYLSAPAWSAALRCRNTSPVVDVKNGSYAGTHNPKYNQDFFLGIPYAKVCKI